MTYYCAKLGLGEKNILRPLLLQVTRRDSYHSGHSPSERLVNQTMAMRCHCFPHISHQRHAKHNISCPCLLSWLTVPAPCRLPCDQASDAPERDRHAAEGTDTQQQPLPSEVSHVMLQDVASPAEIDQQKIRTSYSSTTWHWQGIQRRHALCVMNRKAGMIGTRLFGCNISPHVLFLSARRYIAP